MLTPRRKSPLVYRFAQLFQHLGKRPSEVGAKLDTALEYMVSQAQGIPAGYGDAIPPTIFAGDPGTKGAESAGWTSNTARAAIQTGPPVWPTQKTADEGTGPDLMRADAKIAQGIVTTKGDILTHDGSTAERLPVGANGQTLVAESATLTGLRWITAGEDVGLLVSVASLLRHMPRIPQAQAGTGITIVENALGPIISATATAVDFADDQNILANQIFGG